MKGFWKVIWSWLLLKVNYFLNIIFPFLFWRNQNLTVSVWDTTISIVFCCFVSFPPYYISLPPPTPKGDYAINREGIEYVPICFIYNFMGFPKNLFMGIFKFIFFGQLKKKTIFNRWSGVIFLGSCGTFKEWIYSQDLGSCGCIFTDVAIRDLWFW